MNMKDMLPIVLIFLGIFTGFWLLTDAIGRAVVHFEKAKISRMELCLSEEVPYEDCFTANYYSTSHFQKKNEDIK